ncbi:MAG: hypothetical protein KDJ87_21020 [Rhizobiaceae bacterium]|nr:hypothetical protein [Rhizobiaceae bacterium]
MNPATAIDIRAVHPLSGLEAWSGTGPVHGFADDEAEARAPTLWQRVSERLRKSPSGDDAPAPQARIWY